MTRIREEEVADFNSGQASRHHQDTVFDTCC